MQGQCPGPWKLICLNTMRSLAGNAMNSDVAHPEFNCTNVCNVNGVQTSFQCMLVLQ